jgi:hypothetical protein
MTDDPIMELIALRRRSLDWDWKLVTLAGERAGDPPLPPDGCWVSPGDVTVRLTTLLNAVIQAGVLDNLLAKHEEGDAE